MGKRSLKGLVAVLIVVLTIAGLAVIPVMAEEEETTPPRGENFLARVADYLGISVEDLESAITAARLEMLDEAVAQGRITQKQAERIVERLDERGLPWGFGKRNFRGADLERGTLAERLVAAVEAGEITQEQADRITERLGEGEGFPGRGRRGGLWRGFGACPRW